MHKIVVGEININSVGNKFDSLIAAVVRNIVILLIAETKIDSTKANFILMDTSGSDILVYVHGDIRSRIIKCENFPSTFEGFIRELSFNFFKKIITDLLL